MADRLDVTDASPVAEPAKVAPPPPPEKPVHAEIAEAVPTQADSLRAGVVLPGLDTRAYECAVGEAGKTGSFSGACVRALVGPAIITDLQLTGTCPATLFVFSGKPDRPTWFMLSTPGWARRPRGVNVGPRVGKLRDRAPSRRGRRPRQESRVRDCLGCDEASGSGPFERTLIWNIAPRWVTLTP